VRYADSSLAVPIAQTKLLSFFRLASKCKVNDKLTAAPLSVLPCPLPGGSLIPWPVRLVHMSNFRNERVIGVRVGQHGADREKYFRYCQCWTPLISENVQTDATIRVDVGMIDASSEVDFWGLERIIGREMNS